MHLSILKVVLIAVASALLALLCVFRNAFDTGEGLSDDGPRAVISEFLGYWIGGFLLICSFLAEGKHLEWTLRIVAVIVAIAGFVFSVHFANTTEVPETPDKEPTGFKSDITDIHL
jgi:hypothetical protein